MLYEWDEAKAEANRVKHGVFFSLIEGFDWESAFLAEDNRHRYGEKRNQAIGYIGKRLYVCVYTRRGMVCRVISLRKANDRERKRYEQEEKAR